MANAQRAQRRASLKTARLAWLTNHQMIPRLPSDTQDVDEAQSALLRVVAEEMRYAGLYARTTEQADIRWGVRVLIGELQREAR